MTNSELKAFLVDHLKKLNLELIKESPISSLHVMAEVLHKCDSTPIDKIIEMERRLTTVMRSLDKKDAIDVIMAFEKDLMNELEAKMDAEMAKLDKKNSSKEEPKEKKVEKDKMLDDFEDFLKDLGISIDLSVEEVKEND